MARQLWIDILAPGEGRVLTTTGSPVDPVRDLILYCDPEVDEEIPCACGPEDGGDEPAIGCGQPREVSDMRCATGLPEDEQGPQENLAYDVTLPADFGNDLCIECGQLRGATFRLENQILARVGGGFARYPSCFTDEPDILSPDGVACAAFDRPREDRAPPPEEMVPGMVSANACFRGWCFVDGLQLDLSISLSFACWRRRPDIGHACEVMLSVDIAFHENQIDFFPPTGFFRLQRWLWGKNYDYVPRFVPDRAGDEMPTRLELENMQLFGQADGGFTECGPNVAKCEGQAFTNTIIDCSEQVFAPPRGLQGPFPAACSNLEAGPATVQIVSP